MRKLDNSFVWVVYGTVRPFGSEVPFSSSEGDLIEYSDQNDSLFKGLIERTDTVHIETKTDLNAFDGDLLLKYADSVNNVCVISKLWPPRELIDNYEIKVMQVMSNDEVARLYDAYTDQSKGGES